jgi:apoptotic chromatin condensation inducer in the nucleus
MVPAAQELVERFGIVSHFWMDAIKSQAFVAFEDCEMSRDCKDGLEGVVWPAETGKALHVQYSTMEALKVAAEGESQRQQPKPGNPPAAAAPAPPAPAAPAAAEAVKLDEFFRKTKALPHLYYKPALPL